MRYLLFFRDILRIGNERSFCLFRKWEYLTIITHSMASLSFGNANLHWCSNLFKFFRSQHAQHWSLRFIIYVLILLYSLLLFIFFIMFLYLTIKINSYAQSIYKAEFPLDILFVTLTLCWNLHKYTNIFFPLFVYQSIILRTALRNIGWISNAEKRSWFVSAKSLFILFFNIHHRRKKDD